MNKQNMRRAAEALGGLSFMEWMHLKEAVEQQFSIRVNGLRLSDSDAEDIYNRIERERAGMMD